MFLLEPQDWCSSFKILFRPINFSKNPLPFLLSVSQPSLDQSGRGSLSSYYDSVGGSVSSKEGGPYGHTPQPRPQPEPISHPVITNNSPALVAQALSGANPSVIFQYWISGQSGDHYKEVAMPYFTCNTSI